MFFIIFLADPVQLTVSDLVTAVKNILKESFTSDLYFSLYLAQTNVVHDL